MADDKTKTIQRYRSALEPIWRACEDRAAAMAFDWIEWEEKYGRESFENPKTERCPCGEKFCMQQRAYAPASRKPKAKRKGAKA